MKTVLKLMILTATTLSSAQFANAADCRINLNTRAGAMSGMNDLNCYGDDSMCLNRYQRLVQILTEKGYEITDAKDAPHKLHVIAGSGYACGTGLKWYDYAMIPVSAEMSFSSSGYTITKESYKAGLPVGASHRAVSRALKFVEKFVPQCE